MRSSAFVDAVAQKVLEKERYLTKCEGGTQPLQTSCDLGNIIFEQAMQHLFCPTAAPRSMILRAPHAEEDFQQQRERLARGPQRGQDCVELANTIITRAIKSAADIAIAAAQDPMAEVAAAMSANTAMMAKFLGSQPDTKKPRLETTDRVPMNVKWTFQGHDWCSRWAQRLREGKPSDQCPCFGRCRFAPCSGEVNSEMLAAASKHFSKP